MPTDIQAGRSTYRHGDLPHALVMAGVDLARRGGPEAVVLRAATRTVGVSPNAAYRHFADHAALRRAVAAVAMDEVVAAMRAEQEAIGSLDDAGIRAALRLRAVGAGYLRYAREQPGMFRCAFADYSAADIELSAQGPYRMLSDALDGLLDAGVLAPGKRPGAEIMAWSAVHGLAMLLLEGPLGGLADIEVDGLTEKLLAHVSAGLSAP